MDLSIVVPCYNEEGSLPLLFSAVDDAFATSGVSYELVLVNDGSSDGTSHLLHELPTPASAERIVVVDFSRNFGKESALLAGLQHAEGDAVGLMDADLQQPPATLLEMYRMLQANPSADCVAAFQEHRNEGAVLSFFKHAFYKNVRRNLQAQCHVRCLRFSRVPPQGGRCTSFYAGKLPLFERHVCLGRFRDVAVSLHTGKSR